MPMSVVEYFPDSSGGQCGYCRSSYGSFSRGLWGHVLTCSDYQDLIDRGWRRSGRYCYKPTMDQTCCPQYTIKCDATQFQLTRSQKKVLKKFRNFIIRGQDVAKTSVIPEDSVLLDSDDSEDLSDNDMDQAESVSQAKAEDAEGQLKLKDLDNIAIEAIEDNKNSAATEVDNNATNAVKSGAGPDPSKPKAKKKKEMRKERALAKLKAAGKTEYVRKKKNNVEKTLEELTSLDFPSDSRHKLEIKLVNAQTSDPDFNESYLASFNVFKKYQMVIHKDPPSKCSVSQFKRFLCNASLLQREEDKDQEIRHGAFHQQYIIDGNIVAVGVIDILPHCVSSVYLYYDPDYAFLSPGTLTSLFEIAFTRKLQRERFPEIKNYYMGFYIHSCPKMRYKAKFSPSWLLCPVSYSWVPVHVALPLLDKSKFSRLDSRPFEKTEVETDDILVLFDNKAMQFGLYKTMNRVSKSEKLELLEYASLIGDALSKKILLFRS